MDNLGFVAAVFFTKKIPPHFTLQRAEIWIERKT